MKALTVENKRRWLAGVLYGLLSVYQLYLTKFLVEQATLTTAYFTMLCAIGLVAVSAGMCLWMFHGRQAVSAGARRVVVAGTIFALIFELMTYKNQTDIINYTLYSISPEMVDNTTILYILTVIRFFLMIAAAFCIISTCMEPKKVELEEASADSEEAVSSKEEIVLAAESVKEEPPAEEKELAAEAKEETDKDDA